MVFQKNCVVEKEVYALSFEFILVIFDFLTHGGIASCKNCPLDNFFIIECLTNLLYHGIIVAPGTGMSTLTNSSRPGAQNLEYLGNKYFKYGRKAIKS